MPPVNPASLIGTRVQAPRAREMLLESRQSYAYADANPYPGFAFNSVQWPTLRGPRPTPLPYAQILVTEGAEFLFRNGSPAFSVADDDAADAFLQEVVRGNELGSQWIPLAISAAHQGALAVKFSYDETDPLCPVRLTYLDVPQECRVWLDPHDLKRLLMARIQYPYRDLESGDWFYYREEWTDAEYVTYQPRHAAGKETSAAAFLPGHLEHLGDDGEWSIDDRAENPFGLIPISIIRNRSVKGNPLGEGDCWRTFRLMDRIALAMHGEDFAAQMHSSPVTAFINAEVNVEGPLLPGEPLDVRKAGGTEGQPDAKLLEPHGTARQFTHQLIDKWEELLYQAVGLSRVNPESVTNAGTMTVQAFKMTYQRTIATSDRKRELWGHSGFCPFFKKVLLGLANLGVPEARGFTAEMAVSISWPEYFAETAQDVADTTDRTIKQVDAGLLTPERATERVGVAEKMPKSEIEMLKKELKGQRAAAARRETQHLKLRLASQGAGATQEEGADLADAGGAGSFG